MRDEPTVLHETTRRLRVLLPYDVDPTSLPSDLCRIDGVAAARVNLRMRCVAVEFDGRSEVRAAVLQCLARGHASASRAPIGAGKMRLGDDHVRRSRARTTRQAAAPARAIAQATRWSPALLALAAPFAAGPWRSGLALSSVAVRALQRREALARDPAAVVLDSASLATLALGGQVPVVATSVLLRQLAESLSDRLVGQADELLDRLLPTEAARYRVVRESTEREAWWSLRALRAGDRIRLSAGDVAPLDGCVTDGHATLEPVLPGSEARVVGRGSAVAAGERLAKGTLELRAEADADHSRLARLRAHLRHVIAARDPAGRLTSDTTRLVSLPLTAAALVYGFTQDAARAATMLQADPQQGLDLALPLAREAALYALARSGLVASGLETLARLATARALVLQDSGVLACGRWTVDTIQADKGTSATQVHRWIARLADAAADESPSLPDRLVREWQRHGALLRAGSREVHLAGPARLRKLWGLEMPSTLFPSLEPVGDLRSALRREFAIVSNRRIIARVVLASAWRPGVVEQLTQLSDAGFERIALLAEDSVEPDTAVSPPVGLERYDWIAGGLVALGDWLADVTNDGSPAVIVHTVLRDSVPPGSLGLAPLEAEAGPHGVLAGDPLATLLAARRLSQVIERRLRLRHGFAVAANAALMTASATRWLPPMAVTLMHHGAGLLLLLDSLRLEALQEPGLHSTSMTANTDGDAPLPLTITDTPAAAVHDGENQQ